MPRTLYLTTRSPYARKARIVLLEKALPFEVSAVDFARRSDAFLALSPLGKVPVLVDDDGTVVFDSTVIAEYLEDRYPDVPMYGQTWQDRLVCRLFDELADTAADQAVAAFLARTRFNDPAAEERAMTLAAKALGEIERWIRGGRWIERFTVADAAVLSAVAYVEFRHGRAPLEPFPATRALCARHAERPSVLATVPVP